MMSNQVNQEIKNRIDQNARVLRFISREEMFQKNRKNIKQELSYLVVYSPQEKQIIMESINGSIPSELPAVHPSTISYYRRSSKPVYRTRIQQNMQLDPHMTYQSLFILAGIEQVNFVNYPQIVKEFEKDLQKYLNCNFPEIREMAMIAAGNKIIGRQKEILRMIELDKKQLWVLINHVYERKISYSHLYPHLEDNNQIIYRTLFQMSNNKDDQIIQNIIENQNVLQNIISSLNHFNPEIKKYALRIIGNILAQKQQYAYLLSKYQILNKLYPFLSSNDQQIRKDVCWVLSNFAFEKGPASQLIRNTKLREKLIQLMFNQSDIKIKIQLCHIFSHLTAFAQKIEMFNILLQNNILQVCGQFLQMQDNDLVQVCLFLISKMIDLGDHFSDQQGNIFILKIRNLKIQEKIKEKTFSDSKEIANLSSEIQQRLDDE